MCNVKLVLGSAETPGKFNMVPFYSFFIHNVGLCPLLWLTLDLADDVNLKMNRRVIVVFLV